MKVKEILNRVSNGEISANEAISLLGGAGGDNLGFACVDTDRARRCGMPEIIYCEGKTPDQVVAIVASLKEAGQDVLATRAGPELFEKVSAAHPDAVYHELARAFTIDVEERTEPVGQVAVVAAGTSDLPVAEEAALAAKRMGAKVERVYDVGVAGLHRLMHRIDVLRDSRAIVVVAGMEGALPSVVGGQVDKPIVAVPTSVGYGTNLEGITTLLAMLNSCVPGITVVNIDNGLGAGVAAAMINRIGETAS